MTFQEFLRQVADDVDERLGKILPSADEPPARLHEAMRYSIFAGGKRVRPGLVVLAGETFGASREKLLCGAAAMEMMGGRSRPFLSDYEGSRCLILSTG